MVACSAVVAWSPTASPADPPIPPLPVGSQVELVDGGVIAGRIVSCDDATVVLENLELGIVRLPREVVSGWKASVTSDRDRQQRPVPLVWLARDASSASAGAVLLDNDDVATATTIALGGAVARIGIDGVAEPMAIPLGRIRAIAFAHDRGPALAGERRPVTLLALRDGSRLAVEPLESDAVEDSGTLRLALASPHAKRLVIECQSEAVVAMAGRGASVRSLEHEEIAGSGDRDPPDTPIDSYMLSRSLSGGPLRARGENAFGGFSMEAPGSVTFALRAPADRFEGRVAIDDAEGQGGAVRVKLRAAGEGGKRTAIFESGPIRGGEMPLAIAADAPGMTRLEIELVTEGDERQRARVVWLDPVVIAK
jgi:hypothetical protein